MPIKVRCEGCQNVFSVPDAARGKTVRCPKCETKFRVAEGESGPGAKKKAAPKKGQSEEELLAGLDLSEAEDTSVRICPKCGAEVSQDDRECPECKIDLATGVISAATRRKMGLKGPDPVRYFKVVWKDSWRFTKEYKQLAIRTMVYALASSLVFFGCAFMVTYCMNMPPRVFWGGLGLVAAVVVPGWLWHLNCEIVNAVVDQRERLPRINFDFFGSVTLGITFVSWLAAFLVQMVVGAAGIVLIALGNALIGAILLGVGVLLTIPVLPVAMGHMAMPVTAPGWMVHKVLAGFFKSIGQCLYWCLILFVTCLPILATWGVVGAVSGSRLASFAGTIAYNMAVVPPPDPDEVKRPTPEEGSPSAPAAPTERKPVDWIVLIVPGVVWVVDVALFGFIAIFNVRSCALLVYYCNRNLSLVTIRKEKKYVSKAELRKQREEKRLEEQRQKEEAKRQKQLAKKGKKRKGA